MNKDELARYFDGSKLLRVIYTMTFIDYTDIETPVWTLFKGT